MNIIDFSRTVDIKKAGLSMHAMMQRLFPICRSISGEGVRESLKIIGEEMKLDTKEVPTGKKVFDWNIPQEWNINDAYIKNSSGNRVVDFNASNLHVVSYSVPVYAKMKLSELEPHLHYLKDHPDWVPYRTTYYSENWGFCISRHQYESLNSHETYEVCVDSRLESGYLTYGECFIPGATDREVLLSCHICHPSMCNDNLSGIVLATQLVEVLQQCSLNHSFRILFIPGTIGSIAWLALNEHKLDRIKHGLVLTGVGDPGPITYKRSRQGQAEIDRVVEYVLSRSEDDYRIINFYPYGYDERQYCSPGFNLPVGCFQRTPHGEYPQYHTSADDHKFVKPGALADSFAKCLSILAVADNNKRYVNKLSKCEPQLGKRGLYKAIGGGNDQYDEQMALLWVLNLSDGRNSLLNIAERSNIEFTVIEKEARILHEKGLLEECDDQDAITEK